MMKREFKEVRVPYFDWVAFAKRIAEGKPHQKENIRWMSKKNFRKEYDLKYKNIENC